MEQAKPDRRIEALNGEIAMLKLAVMVLIAHSPNQSATRAMLLLLSEELISNTLASPFPDTSAQAMIAARDLLLRNIVPGTAPA